MEFHCICCGCPRYFFEATNSATSVYLGIARKSHWLQCLCCSRFPFCIHCYPLLQFCVAYVNQPWVSCASEDDHVVIITEVSWTEWLQCRRECRKLRGIRKHSSYRKMQRGPMHGTCVVGCRIECWITRTKRTFWLQDVSYTVCCLLSC